MKIEGISKVNIYGQRPECIYIELYEDKLANLGVHPAEVLATLNGQNKPCTPDTTKAAVPGCA